MSKRTKKSSLRVPDPFRFGCISYHVGHQVHWIQAKHSANNESLHSAGGVAVSAPTWSGKVVGVEGEILTVRKSDGSLARFRNHDPVRLIYILEHLGVEVTVNERWSILRAGIAEAGSFCISVQPDRGEPLEPCLTGDLPSDASAEQLVGRIRTHGGFSVPVGH